MTDWDTGTNNQWTRHSGNLDVCSISTVDGKLHQINTVLYSSALWLIRVQSGDDVLCGHDSPAKTGWATELRPFPSVHCVHNEGEMKLSEHWPVINQILTSGHNNNQTSPKLLNCNSSDLSAVGSLEWSGGDITYYTLHRLVPTPSSMIITAASLGEVRALSSSLSKVFHRFFVTKLLVTNVRKY